MSEEVETNLAESIKRVGQLYPILKSQFGIIDGFHRQLAGATEVKEIQVKNQLEHVVLRYHANQKDKTMTDHYNDNQKCFDDAARILQLREPEVKGGGLVKRLSELFGVSERTVYRYLSSEFKEKRRPTREEELAQLPSEPVQTTTNLTLLSISPHTTRSVSAQTLPVVSAGEGKLLPKFYHDRVHTRLSLARHYPKFNRLLKEMLRNEKPYLRSKDEIDKFWKAATNPQLFFKGEKIPKDPFEVFVRLFYLYSGSYMGWRPELPWWIKLRLEAIAEKKYPNLDANGLLIKIIGDWTCGAKIEGVAVSNEETIKRAKVELLKEWLIDKKEWYQYLEEDSGQA